MKNVLMIVGSRRFRDEEYFETKKAIEESGLLVTTASSREGPVRGTLGGWAKAETTIYRIGTADYDAIVFVGGEGAREFVESRRAWHLCQQALSQGKVLGAICMAPLILAKALVLKGVRVTCWPDVAKEVEAFGALYVGGPVVKDGKVVTADGPTSARAFGKAVAEMVLGRDGASARG